MKNIQSSVSYDGNILLEDIKQTLNTGIKWTDVRYDNDNGITYKIYELNLDNLVDYDPDEGYITFIKSGIKIRVEEKRYDPWSVVIDMSDQDKAIKIVKTKMDSINALLECVSYTELLRWWLNCDLSDDEYEFCMAAKQSDYENDRCFTNHYKIKFGM